MHVWTQEKGSIWLRSDAKAAIGAGRKLRSAHSAGVNRIMAEISLALAMAKYTFDLIYEHIPGFLNVCAGALSRLVEPGMDYKVPAELDGSSRRGAELHGPGWWLTPPGYAFPPAVALLDDAE